MSYDEMILTIAGNGLATSRLRREVRMVAQSPTALEPV